MRQLLKGFVRSIPVVPALVAATVVLAGAMASPSLQASGPGIHEPGSRLWEKADRHYQAENYRSAMRSFRSSARWGSKPSQYTIGVMHYHGRGVARDIPRAWAWIELSAERGYPQMTATANRIWDSMSAADRRQAREILEEELLPVYGDDAALPRTERFMERRYRQASGSRLGGNGSSPVTVQESVGWNVSSGDMYYDEERWDVQRLIERERAWFNSQRRPSVRIRDLAD